MQGDHQGAPEHHGVARSGFLLVFSDEREHPGPPTAPPPDWLRTLSHSVKRTVCCERCQGFLSDASGLVLLMAACDWLSAAPPPPQHVSA
ncbi:unnamed protein product [Boreogadus saida]